MFKFIKAIFLGIVSLIILGVIILFISLFFGTAIMIGISGGKHGIHNGRDHYEEVKIEDGPFAEPQLKKQYR